MSNIGQRSSRLALTAALAAALLIALPIFAQEQPTAVTSAPQAAAQSTPDQDSSSKPAAKTAAAQTDEKPDAPIPHPTKNDRIFGILPNYATVGNQDTFGKLSAKQKYKLSYESILDRYTFPFIGVVSLIGQAQNSEPAYGQGFEGYGKRYATSFADAAIGTTMTTSVFPTMLHQDPRYFQLGRGTILHRTEYSLSRLFVTRSDSGYREFNSSEVAGNLIAAGISNAYHPVEDRTVANTMSVWGTDIMWDGVSNVLKEFWPDIRRHFTKHHHDDEN